MLLEDIVRTRAAIVAIGSLMAITLFVRESGVSAAPGSLNCSLTDYKAAPGLVAALTGDELAVTWDGDRNQELRLRFSINNGTPTMQELAVRRKGATWGVVASAVTPEFR